MGCGVVRLHGKVHEMPSLSSPLCFDSACRLQLVLSSAQLLAGAAGTEGLLGATECAEAVEADEMPATEEELGYPVLPAFTLVYLFNLLPNHNNLRNRGACCSRTCSVLESLVSEGC